MKFVFLHSRLIVIFLCLSVPDAEASRYWPPKILVDWSLSLNNGVAYISSPQFAEHCIYGRGQINMDGTEFNKSLYAYAMSAKARGLNLRYVVDDTHSVCVITGLEEI